MLYFILYNVCYDAGTVAEGWIRGFSLFAGGWGLELNFLEKRGLNVSGSGLCMMVSFGGSKIGREAVSSLLVLLILLVRVLLS